MLWEQVVSIGLLPVVVIIALLWYFKSHVASIALFIAVVIFVLIWYYDTRGDEDEDDDKNNEDIE
jgi:hypothetical protein